jgi:cytosine/adenosine deaminase-related metal-dependent hydrolase
MLLSNVHIVGVKALQHILVEAGKIRSVAEDAPNPGSVKIEFENALAFPGLINSHDHLDFNLFPQLGNGMYDNYMEWGKDIHANNKDEIDAVLKIPQALRVQWGIYKNLLNGVTTVVNHGERLELDNELITVLQNNHSLHSVGFEKNWKRKLNNPFKKNIPFVIHMGEGKDAATGDEIDELIKWNLFKKPLIAVHGVAMSAAQAAGFKALVWCPASNYFLLDKTANVEKLKMNTSIIFGTDSTLTAGWNIWEHIRLARKQNGLTDEELFNALTKTAAAVWGLDDAGSISTGQHADMVIAKVNDPSLDSFYAVNPADILLVMHKGNMSLFDESIKDQVINGGAVINNFDKIVIGRATKYIRGDISGLIEKIKTHYPGAMFPVSA